MTLEMCISSVDRSATLVGGGRGFDSPMHEKECVSNHEPDCCQEDILYPLFIMPTLPTENQDNTSYEKD